MDGSLIEYLLSCKSFERMLVSMKVDTFACSSVCKLISSICLYMKVDTFFRSVHANAYLMATSMLADTLVEPLR